MNHCTGQLGKTCGCGNSHGLPADAPSFLASRWFWAAAALSFAARVALWRWLA